MEVTAFNLEEVLKQGYVVCIREGSETWHLFTARIDDKYYNVTTRQVNSRADYATFPRPVVFGSLDKERENTIKTLKRVNHKFEVFIERDYATLNYIQKAFDLAVYDDTKINRNHITKTFAVNGGNYMHCMDDSQKRTMN